VKDFPELCPRTALLIVDMQIAFFEEPILQAHRAVLVENCNALADAARTSGMPIFNIRTEHKKDKSTWTLSMLDDDQGFLFEGTDQAKNLGGLDLAEATEVVKRRDSAFWDTGLGTQLVRQGVGSLIVTGVSSHTCVASTAADAYARNLRVWLVKDAIASTDPTFEDTTLALLHREYRQKIVSTNDLLHSVG
jgi:nicotinamidase-related amidase